MDQTTGGAADLVLNGTLVTGGVATSAAAQKVSVEGTGDNSGITFTFTGTDADGSVETEVVTGANNGTATTTLYYLTIDTIAASGAVTGNVEVGWLKANGAVGKSLVQNLTNYFPEMSVTGIPTGTLTFTIQHTQDVMPSTVEPNWFDTVDMVGKTAQVEGNILLGIGATRGKITSYTSGTLKVTILQSNQRRR